MSALVPSSPQTSEKKDIAKKSIEEKNKEDGETTEEGEREESERSSDGDEKSPLSSIQRNMLPSKVCKLEKQVEKLEEKNENLNNKVKEKGRQLTSAKVSVKKLQERNEQLEKQLAAAKSELAAEIENLAQKTETLIEKETGNVKKNTDKLEAANKKLEAANEKLAKEIATVKIEMKESVNALKVAAKEKKALSDELSNKTTELNTAHGALQQLNTQHEEALKSANKQQKHSKKSLKRLSEEHERELDRLKGEVHAAKQAEALAAMRRCDKEKGKSSHDLSLQILGAVLGARAPSFSHLTEQPVSQIRSMEKIEEKVPVSEWQWKDIEKYMKSMKLQAFVTDLQTQCVMTGETLLALTAEELLSLTSDQGTRMSALQAKNFLLMLHGKK